MGPMKTLQLASVLLLLPACALAQAGAASGGGTAPRTWVEVPAPFPVTDTAGVAYPTPFLGASTSPARNWWTLMATVTSTSSSRSARAR
jgi:hypothetical protein